MSEPMTQKQQQVPPAPAPTSAPEPPKPVTAAEEPKAEKMVTVSEESLKKMMTRLDMLEEIADKARLQRYQAAHSIETNKKCKVSTLGGKVVVGWHKIKDDVSKGMNGLWTETQVVGVVTEDGAKAEMPYVEFARIPKIPGEIVGRRQESGHEYIKIKLDDREQPIELERTFVN